MRYTSKCQQHTLRFVRTMCAKRQKAHTKKNNVKQKKMKKSKSTTDAVVKMTSFEFHI